MRILVVADLHYSLKQFDWVRARMTEMDLVVIAGDMLDLASAVDLEVQVVSVQSILRRCAAERSLIASSGNHDLFGLIAGGERAAVWLEDMASDVLRVDHQTWSRDGVVVSVCPWWDGPVGKARMLERLQTDAALPKDQWIWVHHNPPDGTPIAWTGSTHGGDTELPALIGRFNPDLVFSGHIHHAPFYAGGSWHAQVGPTRVFNPGRQLGSTPTSILVDLQRKRAEWCSVEGVEVVEW
jgi:Icc-related predicted phosphoesterase